MKSKSVPCALLLVALVIAVVASMKFWRHEGLDPASLSPVADPTAPAASGTGMIQAAAPALPTAEVAVSPARRRMNEQNHFWDVPNGKPDFALFADWVKEYSQAQSPARKAA